LYYPFFDEAEKVRWKMSDIPFGEIERDRVSAAELRIVRELAYSEMTTFNATRQFFDLFEGDPDITQWLTVWLYEESKHGHSMMRWLAEFGEVFDKDYVLSGREAFPMLDSQAKMLATNVMSEMVVSNAYFGLSKFTEEPVLRLIARNLAADEARHAAQFFSYCKKLIAVSPDPARKKLDAVEMLAFWVMNDMQVKHPAGILYQQLKGLLPVHQIMPQGGERRDELEVRMCAMIGNLVDETIATKQQAIDIMFKLRKAAELEAREE